MKEKLTLTIEKETKKRAKAHAKAIGKSVSEMVEEFLNHTAAKHEEEWQPPKGSAVERLMNLIPESEKEDNPDYDQLRHEALKEKYSLD